MLVRLDTVFAMRIIDIGRGFQTCMDDEDFERFGALKWRFAKRRNGAVYVQRMVWDRAAKRPRCQLLHREIMNAPSGSLVDHRDSDGLNNQRYNLRVCSSGQNNQHARKQHRATSSRFKGVCKRRDCRRWEAYIKVGKKRKHLGLFEGEQDAARAYNTAARELHGEFAVLNALEL